MARSMRWDCERQGCFNIKKRLKLQMFDECFPGKIGFGDIDGIVEINGNVLVIEGKGFGAPLPTGQRIMFERMTAAGGVTVFVVELDAETMVVSAVTECHKGKWAKRAEMALEGLRSRVKAWAGMAKANRRPGAQKPKQPGEPGYLDSIPPQPLGLDPQGGAAWTGKAKS